LWKIWPLSSLIIGFACSAIPLFGSSTPAAADQISDLQAKASQIEQQINAETQQIGVLGQKYDQAQGQIQTLNAEIASTRAQIAADDQKVTVDRSNLQKVAINSYINSGSTGAANPLFASNQKNFAVAQEYGQVATGSLDVAVANLHTAQVQLNGAEASLTTQQQQQQAAANAAQAAERQAQAQQSQMNATLGSVKGQIATLVAQQQAAAAAAQAAATQARLAAANRQAAGSSSAATASYPPAPPAGGAGGAVSAAESQLGVPYVWGGTDPRGTSGDPSGGFDCSGLVMWAWAQAGVQLPHYSGAQFDDTTPVSVSDMEPGDILFYGPGGDEHEAMYVGSGEMIEAPETGEVVHITPIRLGDGFAGVHRV
jgi:cell wall-associated NlpC family hydrolase